MTVWTNVTLHDANKWLAARGFGKALALLPIEDGVEDSVYRVNLTDGSSVCLRLFERTEPEGTLTIASRLAEHDLPTCPPLPDNNNCFLLPLNDKPAALFPWIEGAWIAEPSLKQIATIGAFMGRMAQIGLEHCADWTRENPRGWDWFEATARALDVVLDPALRSELDDEVAAQIAFWKSPQGLRLPHGPVHGDLFRNNVMWTNGDLAAVIDWGIMDKKVWLGSGF